MDMAIDKGKMLAKKLKEVAAKRGLSTVLEGTNASELEGHRPGFRAVEEEGLASPLVEAGLTKDDVRALAQSLGLPNWSKPSMACLSSRFPPGAGITAKKLAVVEAAESYILALGVSQLRVRHLEKEARIEVLPSEFEIIFANRESIAAHFKKLGFRKVTLDLAGYRTGSLSAVQSPDS